ncbi:MAG: glycosyltransferase family 2 protein [Pirellulaceae bacterium]
MVKLPLISIIVPVLNEDQNIQRLYDTVCNTMDVVADRYRYEFVFTDNHSTDRSFEVLTSLAEQDDRVRVLRFSRNFGYQASIMTGYLNANGDAVIQLDCDLQDPPAMIIEFLEHWEQGYHVVYGVRKQRKEGVAISLLRRLFYRLINSLSEHPLPVDAGDFRLVDRRIVEELRKTDDSTPYIRGKIATLGFNQIGIAYDRGAREHGESKFNFGDLTKLAVDGILNHSTAPLRLATYCSQAIFVGAMIVMAVYCMGRLTIGRDWPAGFATLSVLILVSTSLNALLFGIMGEYIGRIYRQVKKSPLTIVEESVNIQDTPVIRRTDESARAA